MDDLNLPITNDEEFEEQKYRPEFFPEISNQMSVDRFYIEDQIFNPEPKLLENKLEEL